MELQTFFIQLMIIVIVSAIIITFFASKLPALKGFIGEFWIRIYLRKLDKTKYSVFHNIILPTEDNKTTQIDHIIISIYGIFVIETKNYKGWIFGDEKSRQWTQVIYKNKQRFQNPIHQNFGHIETLKSILGNDDVPYYSVIAFSSSTSLKKIDIYFEHINVIYDNQVLILLNNYHQQRLTLENVEQLSHLLESKALKGKDAHKQHIESVKQTQLIKRHIVKFNRCPKCGGQLKERNGKYGLFKGCSNYPKCRYTA
ncbi:NERD domain-containing protein [Bacillus sp. Marseille-Q3570]|uniref:NERD domain-containing protein n=1 Tax=Bacillus sp. Marseille-Q3570 TaxID=2963522 RepID=UPI0021B83CA1|nr:NERD domain-containing protein [Bacillus sp. Marseille-Q3570]